MQNKQEQEKLETVYFLCEIYRERHPELKGKRMSDIFNLVSGSFKDVSLKEFETYCDEREGEER